MIGLLLVAVVFAGIAGAPLWVVIAVGAVVVWLLWRRVAA